MQSFASVTSGLAAAQAGLYTTGHNISNASTVGYTRQRTNFADSSYRNAAYNNQGTPMKVGLGTGLVSISQIRDEFLDKTYRKAASKGNFYAVKLDVVNKIEDLMGELYGDARLSDTIDELWTSLQNLATHPDGIETRAMFIQSAKKFVTKTEEISQGLYDYQVTLNNEIIKGVNRINEITTQIEDLNKKIGLAESCGDNANDYRDTRNMLVDELSTYGFLDLKEDSYGRLTILMDGKDIVSNGSAKLLGLRYTTDDGYPFVEPIFSDTYVKDGVILSASDPARRLFTDIDSGYVGGVFDNDNGSLKAMMLARGKAPANHLTPAKDANSYTIPKFQRELDILVNSIVTMINDMMAPRIQDGSAPVNLEDEQYIELFSRKYVERYDANGNYIEEDTNPPRSLYSMGNLKINEEVLNDFNRLCLSNDGSRADTSLIQSMLDAWKGNNPSYLPRLDSNSTPLSFESFYREIVTRLGEEGNTAKVYVQSQEMIIVDTEAARQSLSGVALDEELTEMMKYQHAYDASAKMVNVIDGMIEVIVNGLKR